jgi:hypothetical protein
VLRFGRRTGAGDEVCCVDAAGFLCVLFLVEVEEHPIDGLVLLNVQSECSIILLCQVHMHFQCPAQRAVADLGGC